MDSPAGGDRAPFRVERIGDVSYGEADGMPLLLDAYRPDPAPAGPMPALVWLHGGAWAFGEKETVPRLLRTLAGRGFFVVSVGYRLSGQATFPAQIHDAKAAVRWLRAHAAEYGVDPGRIGAGGHSAGGHLAALLGTSGDVPELEGDGGSPGHSSRVQAAVPISAPIDALRWDERCRPWPPEDGPWEWLVGGPLRERPALVRMTNPLTYVTADATPFLVVHGVADETVPVSQSDLLCEALRGAGVDVEYRRVAGGLHHFAQAIDPARQDEPGYWPRVIHDLLPRELEEAIFAFLQRRLVG